MYEILKKKFGQNFLIDENILNKICGLIPNDHLNIVEIGPGDGRLTNNILRFSPNELKIIEIDSDLIPLLKKKFDKFKNIKILNDDILNYELNDKPELIISNLPYNISSQILAKICLMKYLPKNLILMFQKEFAHRLINKKLNSLNSLVKCFYDIENRFNVSKNCFRPIPKVDSTVLFFKKKKKVLLKKNEVLNFIEFKRYLFTHKRKTLNKLLKNYRFNKELFDLNQRVENITIQQLLRIFREINL